MTTTRSLREIAQEIAKDWSQAMRPGDDGFGEHPAHPYIMAMLALDNIHQDYYQDSARTVVMYFLSNAGNWRGETARRIKAELKVMLYPIQKGR